MSETAKVYKAILNVAGDLAKEGIEKAMKNQQQGFLFRGIDQVYNSLAGLLVKHSLVIAPVEMIPVYEERTTAKGNALIYARVQVRYDLISAEDGSKITVSTVGEAMDSGDKASNKAMSAAYKYAVFQTFCVPTEGDNDADTSSPRPKLHYGEAAFRKNFPEWQERIAKGKTPENRAKLAEAIVAKVSTKYVLTEEQEEQVRMYVDTLNAQEASHENG